MKSRSKHGANICVFSSLTSIEDHYDNLIARGPEWVELYKTSESRITYKHVYNTYTVDYAQPIIQLYETYTRRHKTCKHKTKPTHDCKKSTQTLDETHTQLYKTYKQQHKTYKTTYMYITHTGGLFF